VTYTYNNARLRRRTAKDISQVPPELLRKGWLDELFFVDLPRGEEGKEIFAIHLAKRGRDAGSLGRVQRPFQRRGNGAGEAFRQSVPLAKTMDEHIHRLRTW
jgi:SpoVK/Ycf46/Vps4 family AAA+-type ATPase